VGLFHLSFLNFVFICLAGFIAAAVDSIAGGGGLISLPAVMAVGVPTHASLGTNKFASTCASFTSTLTFAKSKKIYMPLIKYLIPCTLVGAALGVNTALRIDQTVLQVMVLVLIFAVAIYTIIKKDFGSEDRFKELTRLNIFYGCLFAFALGFYDGFFGPGTGSFLIFLFISVFGFDFTISAGNGKILNFVSNITSLVLFAINGKIMYFVGIPMAISMIFGARIGTRIAIKNGAKVIKPIFVTIALVLTAKLLYQNLIKLI
jgi:uncharacterized membrane protein YfcA